MSLIDYGRIIARRGWIVLLLAIIAAGAAYVVSTQMTEIYRATQRVLIQPTRADLSLTESSKTLLGSHRAYLDSQFVAQDVIDRLQLDMQAGELLSHVTIGTDPNELTIQIDVDLPDQAVAADVARTWGEMLIEYRNAENQRSRNEDHINARLQDTPRISLLQPRPMLNAVAGAVMGILLGAIIVFVLEYLESSVIRHRDDLERQLEVPVLATIPDLEG